MSGESDGHAGRRIQLPGASRQGPEASFRFDGRPVPFFEGETIAAALLASGIRAMRRTRQGEGRGPYCGMGVCGECLVDVGGRHVRACLQKATPGQDVRTAHPLSPARGPEDQPSDRPAAQLLEPDLLIVGAGPAGLSAAAVAAGGGLDVVVVDERSQAGGQYFKQPAQGFTIDRPRLDQQFRAGASLIAEAKEAGASFIFGTTVWAGRSEPLEVFASSPRGPLRMRPRLLFLAQGAYELSVAVPGWTLPGVMTTGAAQTFLRAYMTTPGQRVLIAGNGPLNLQLASELTAAGASVVAVADTARMPGPGKMSSAFQMLRRAPALVADGVRQMSALRFKGVPLLYRTALTGVEGDRRVEAAVVARIDAAGQPIKGTERRYEVDTVCSGYGFAPQSELARAFGCVFEADPRTGAPRAVRADDGETSVERVHVIGDGGGLNGAPAACAQGRLAGWAARRRLGKDVDTAAEQAARRKLLSARAFQSSLWSLYEAPLYSVQGSTPDTLICRCEAVTRDTVEKAFSAGFTGIGSLKRATRTGMGRCQGRYCGRKVSLIAGGGQPGSEAHFAPRSPAKPIPLKDVAAFAEQTDFS
jgi:NADPH-dependent 2,4-dienoyl-CoA reductase/sulfur reductase-like enzyme